MVVNNEDGKVFQLAFGGINNGNYCEFNGHFSGINNGHHCKFNGHFSGISNGLNPTFHGRMTGIDNRTRRTPPPTPTGPGRIPVIYVHPAEEEEEVEDRRHIPRNAAELRRQFQFPYPRDRVRRRLFDSLPQPVYRAAPGEDSDELGEDEAVNTSRPLPILRRVAVVKEQLGQEERNWRLTDSAQDWKNSTCMICADEDVSTAICCENGVAHCNFCVTCAQKLEKCPLCSCRIVSARLCTLLEERP